MLYRMGNLFDNHEFEIMVNDLKIVVIEQTVRDQQIFRLVFDDNRAPMEITSAKTWAGEVRTSIL